MPARQERNLYVGARYNTVEAGLSGFDIDISIHRNAFAAGWFLNHGILLKSENVIQNTRTFQQLIIGQAANLRALLLKQLQASDAWTQVIFLCFGKLLYLK